MTTRRTIDMQENVKILLTEPAKGIATLGFERWYERQLIESHAYLVTCLLCIVAALAAIEEFSVDASGLKPLLMLSLIAGGLLIGIFSCRRYLATLAYAQHVADSSTCAACKTYAAYAVLNSDRDRNSSSVGTAWSKSPWFGVKCRKCGHRWTIC